MTETRLMTDRPNDPRVSIVIPAKNEAQNLSVILNDLPDVHEVILVDGDSSDGTVDVAKQVLPDVRVINQTRKGKGNALACGFEAVTGDVIVMFDADCSADPDEIPRFVDTLVNGADFAKGSRFRPGGGSADITPFRAVGNKALNVMANRMLRAKYTDLCYGYNAFWVDVLPHLALPSPEVGSISPDESMIWGDGFEIETVINCRIAAAGLRTDEVPSYEQLRVFGDSNLHAIKDGMRVLRTIATERRRVGRIKAERRADAHQRAAAHAQRHHERNIA